jgi:NTE family protein
MLPSSAFRRVLPTGVGMSLEYGGVWNDLDALESDDLLVSGSVYLGLDTLVGPAYVGFGLTEGGEHSVYVFIGPVF